MIDLSTPLTLRSSFAFPLQSRLARREVLIGAALLLLPVVGWLLNLGHRVMMVHRMQHGLPPWPAWREPRQLLRHGAVTFAGMVLYAVPAGVAGALAWWLESRALAGGAALLFLAAVVAIPGYMTRYCLRFDPAEIHDPFRALGRVRAGGRAYLHAWGIALAALALSLLGLLAVGIGFLVTSVWFWQVAGFGFARVFSSPYLAADGAAGTTPAYVPPDGSASVRPGTLPADLTG